MEVISSSSASSSKTSRGCRGFGVMESIGSSAKWRPRLGPGRRPQSRLGRRRGSADRRFASPAPARQRRRRAAGAPFRGAGRNQRPESVPRPPAVAHSLDRSLRPMCWLFVLCPSGRAGRRSCTPRRAARSRVPPRDRTALRSNPGRRSSRSARSSAPRRSAPSAGCWSAAPRCRSGVRTSSATWEASRVRPSYMVSRIVETCRSGLRWPRTSSTLRSSWPSPSSA